MARTLKRDIPVSLLLIVGIALLFIPFLTFGIVDGVRLASAERKQVETDAVRVATEIRANLDRSLSSYIAILQTLAESPSIDDRSFHRLYEQANAVLMPLGLHVLMREPTGQQLFNTRVPFGTVLPSENGFDDEVLETGKPYVTDIVIGSVAHKPVIGLSVPVLRDGEIASILTMSIDPTIFVDLLVAARLPAGWIVSIVDRNGNRIARSQEHERYLGEPLPEMWQSEALTTISHIEAESGNTYVRAARVSLVSGWQVVVSGLETTIAENIAWTLGRFIALAVLMTIVVLGAAYMVGRHIVVEAGRMVDAANRLGKGQSLTTTPSFIREANMINMAMTAAAEQRDRHEQQIRLLMREVHHRSKNMLTIVQVMARRTEATSITDFRQKLGSRIAGLGANLDLLMTNNWEGANLTDLVHSYVEMFGDLDSDRFVVCGPELTVSAAASQAIGMALHELATNATKYGSLSNATGSVEISWSCSASGEDARLVFVWHERGGPPVTPGKTKGFGHAILVGSVESSLNGNVVLDYAPDGLRWKLDCPLTSAVAKEF